MTVTIENGLSKKSLADRESALRTINMEIDAISNLKDSVALENLTAALDLMQNATGRIIITGMGKSGHIGNKIAASFNILFILNLQLSIYRKSVFSQTSVIKTYFTLLAPFLPKALGRVTFSINGTNRFPKIIA